MLVHPGILWHVYVGGCYQVPSYNYIAYVCEYAQRAGLINTKIALCHGAIQPLIQQRSAEVGVRSMAMAERRLLLKSSR